MQDASGEADDLERSERSKVLHPARVWLCSADRAPKEDTIVGKAEQRAEQRFNVHAESKVSPCSSLGRRGGPGNAEDRIGY